MADVDYPGDELHLFADARNWKSYWSAEIGRFVTGDVLEVGSGLGVNIPFFGDKGITRWTSVEPDPGLAALLKKRISESAGAARHEVICGTLRSVAGRRFDTILYIDVLEHIEADADELQQAARALRPGGCLIVLAPAWQALRSPFDDAVGHVRRYDRPMLRTIAPEGVTLVRLNYLDSAGLLATVMNLVLRRRSPSRAQLLLWDRGLVPLSRVLDRLLGHAIGKSVLAVWRKS